MRKLEWEAATYILRTPSGDLEAYLKPENPW